MSWLPWVLAPLGGVLLLLVIARAAIVLGGIGVNPVDPLALVTRPREAARVERLPNQDLRFTWDVLAEQVSICAGRSPEQIDWQRPLLVVMRAEQAVLTGMDPAQRTYFGLAFTQRSGAQQRLVVAERHLPLQGARNFRDLGGYRAADGRSVRWGRIFRSDQLHNLTDSDQAYLERIGIRAVCDLRDADERVEKPDRPLAQAEYHSLPIYEDAPRAPMMNVLLFRRRHLGAAIARNYIGFLEHGAPSYGRLLRLAAAGQPLVFHCAAGKDRAGIAAALLLSLLGVPDETILADYSLSNLAFEHSFQSFASEQHLRRLGVPNEQVRIMFVVDPTWLQDLFAHLRQTYGSLEGYLLTKAGVEEETLARLRADLLVG